MKVTKHTNNSVVINGIDINQATLHAIEMMRSDNMYETYIDQVISTLLDSTLGMEDEQRLSLLECMEKLNIIRNSINEINTYEK